MSETLARMESLGARLGATLDEPDAPHTIGWLHLALDRAALITRTPLPPRSWLTDGGATSSIATMSLVEAKPPWLDRW